MASLVFKLSNTANFPWNIVPKPIPGVTDVLLRAMENVYGCLGNGAASITQASAGNWATVYQGESATTELPVPTNSA
jgi:hypothetical protein